MSKTQYTEMSISEVIEESNLIVEVEFVANFIEEVLVVNRDLKNTSTTLVPPFLKTGVIFKIHQVLKNKDSIPLPEKITVPDENWRRALNQHKEKYMNAPAKSYHIPQYISEVKSMKKATVLFLHHFQDRYELTARNSFEGSEALEKITILLENV